MKAATAMKPEEARPKPEYADMNPRALLLIRVMPGNESVGRAPYGSA